MLRRYVDLSKVSVVMFTGSVLILLYVFSGRSDLSKALSWFCFADLATSIHVQLIFDAPTTRVDSLVYYR